MDVNVRLSTDRERLFEAFVASEGSRLRRALVARYGVEVGNDVANDALTHAWSRWSVVESMSNPVGYLYRVAQSAARPHWRWRRRVALVPADDRIEASLLDGEVFTALARLSHEQRVAVLLVHGYGYSYAEVASVLGVGVIAVNNYVHRGVARLRNQLEDRNG